MVTDTRVGADTQADVFDIGAQAFGQVRHFIHKADFGSEHGVGRVFGELG